jgi:hypothetical protein
VEESKVFVGDIQTKKKEQDMLVLLQSTQGTNTSQLQAIKTSRFFYQAIKALVDGIFIVK